MVSKRLIPISLLLLITFSHFIYSVLNTTNCVENRGIGFGLLARTPILLLLITLMLGLFLLIRAIQLYNAGKFQEGFFYFLASVGGLGNFIDRLVDGSVCDYIDLSYLLRVGNFPIFNLNDILIIVGVLFVVVINLKRKSNGTV